MICLLLNFQSQMQEIYRVYLYDANYRETIFHVTDNDYPAVCGLTLNEHSILPVHFDAEHCSDAVAGRSELSPSPREILCRIRTEGLECADRAVEREVS